MPKRSITRKTLAFLCCCLAFMQVQASPGDTTWVQAQNDVQLTYYNDYDQSVTFPTGAVSYRKILMVFTLGKYQCPGGEQYCGDWDYTVQNYLFTPTDTVELSRLITPYANAGAPRTPWSWKQRYYFDVTDFYPLLRNNATIRLAYHNYSGGFTGNIKFAFIEGTPPRNVTGITKLWEGAFNYGDATTIENNVPARIVTAPAGTQSAEMKFTVTGHGSDNAGCSEFCSKYYQVRMNNTLLEQKQIWKSDCGSNNLYPQSGTWIYNRANWCPGEQVLPFSHVFPNVGSGTAYIADVDFQTYTKSGSGSPQYILSGYMIHYGGYNRTVDATLEEVLTPTNYEGSFRMNPAAGKPVVRIRNTGSTIINTVTFQYGVAGQAPQTYTVTGLSLGSMQQTIVNLADLTALSTLPNGSDYKFTATITGVNGAADNDALNNSLTTTFATAPIWPASFYMRLRTNNFPTQTSWVLQDMNGTIISSRNPTAALTFYNDLIGPLADGAYKITVTDANCDGLYWWANSGSTGLGAVFAQTADQSAIIPFTHGLPAVVQNGTQLSVPSYSQDFGCGFTQYFRVGAALPVFLLSFNGAVDGNQHKLNWQTTREANAKQFEIEYSTNGTYFTKVADVKANGNSTAQSNYSTVYSPVEKADKYYYRLKMVDNDGSFKYSNIIVLRSAFAGFSVLPVTPNPFGAQVNVTINSLEAAGASIKLYDALGRLQQQKAVALQKGVNSISLNGLEKLAAGVYLLEVISGDHNVQQKLIRN